MRILLLAITLLLAACTSVKPWEKGYLAKPTMAFDPDPVEARLRNHIYTSKEAASGGNGVGNGGCGCN
jgi:starvation-inducible outer membrane lipoprotein